MRSLRTPLKSGLFYFATITSAWLGCSPPEEEMNNIPEPNSSSVSCTTGQIENDFGNCVSEVPYACGWKRNNPGNLKSSGSEGGDVVANLSMVDQCGEKVDLWDFSGEYNILWMSAAW